MTKISCRVCANTQLQTMVDLGVQPLANSYVPPSHALEMEPHYPLLVLHCPKCHLVQLPSLVTAEAIFSDYQYFSSYSQSWLDHAKAYVDKVVDRFKLDENSHVVEIASNDGYLLQYMIEKNIPALGIEPAENVAKIANEKGVPTIAKFFGVETAKQLVKEGKKADLMAANNVFAHVPDLNDFIGGFKLLLKDEAVLTIEFPHLMNLIELNQFDTIYHEHYSYYSLIGAMEALKRHGLRVFDVDTLSTHGGSLRIYICHDNASHKRSENVDLIEKEERDKGYDKDEVYKNFSQKCLKVKQDLLEFLFNAKAEGKMVAAYGAPAKGNTMLNYCGIGTDLISFTVDRNPHKQNHLLPGSRIPIESPNVIAERKPDYLIILPWNLTDEISQQMNHIKEWGGKFVTAVPELKVF